MAGSLNHIIDTDGRFTMDRIENLGDAHEALKECFNIIAHLTHGDTSVVSAACDAVGAVDPYDTEDADEERKAAMVVEPE